LSGIGGLVPCATSPDSVYPDLYAIAIPHDSVYSHSYPYPITHTNPESYPPWTDAYSDSHPNRHPHCYSYADDYGDFHRDPDGVALSHQHGHTDQYNYAYGNPYRHGDPDATPADANRHPNSHAHTVADGYRNRHSDSYGNALTNEHGYIYAYRDTYTMIQSDGSMFDRRQDWAIISWP